MVPKTIPAHNRHIDWLVVHCTATKQTATIAAIQRYWQDALKWKSPGYHYIVMPDGEVVTIHPERLPSNGVAGYNSNSIHISYIGGIDGFGNSVDNRTDAQKDALREALRILKIRYPDAKIQGHRDFPKVAKDCPCFNAKTEYANLKPAKLNFSDWLILQDEIKKLQFDLLNRTYNEYQKYLTN